MKEFVPGERVYVDALLPGDILLMMGDSEISRAIAWCSNSEYSHAAIVADGGNLFEAAPPHAHLSPIEKSVRSGHYLHIRAFRPHYLAGQPMTPADRQIILRKIHGSGKIPYPLGDMITLGAAVAASGKLVENPRLRTFLAMLIGILLAEDEKTPPEKRARSCAELVYCCLKDNDALPQGRLAPVILFPERRPKPVWEVDLPGLFREFCEEAAKHPEIWKYAEVFCKHVKNDDNAVPVSEEEFERVLAKYRDVLGAQAAGDAAIPNPNPNPRLVQPEDLAVSPTCVPLGDVKVRGD